MRVQKMVVIISLVALAGCSSSLKQSGGYITQPEVCVDRWYGYHLGTGCPSTAKAVVPDPAQEEWSPEQPRQRSRAAAGECQDGSRPDGIKTSRHAG